MRDRRVHRKPPDALGLRGARPGKRTCGLWASYLVGQKRPLPKGLVAGLVLSAIVGQAAIFICNRQIRLFWDEVRGPWRAHERALSRHQPPQEDTSS